MPPHTHPVIPDYLETNYWWAYVHPLAVSIFEREWLVNFILFGNYKRLCGIALDSLGERISGKTLQIACVYGNLTARLVQRMAHDATLGIVDILPIQLENLRQKISPDPRVSFERSDSCALPYASASQDQALLFFLLHEQPQATRRASLSEALRVLKPGGKLVIVDYHKPHAMHPLRPLMRQIFKHLEPFAMDLWQHPMHEYLPLNIKLASIKKTTFFGGLYQLLVLER